MNIFHYSFMNPNQPSVPLADKYQVTEWAPPEDLIETGQWGCLSYKQYLACESGRWAESWRDAWIELGTGENDGAIALFTHRDASIKPINIE